MAERDSSLLPRLSQLSEEILILLDAHPCYGSALMASINCARDSVGIRPLQIGSLYPALERMESQGLIVSSEPAFPETGNNRRYYRLTDLGKQSLDAARAYRAILSGPADA